MRILLVEDQAAQAEAITSAFGVDVTFVWVTTRDEAFEAIETQDFDLALCDLKIPSSAGGASDVEHGLAVLTAVRERCAGTPVVTFTAYKTKEVLDLFLRSQRQEDFLGTTVERPMLLVREKDELPELLEHLNELRVEFASLDDIEVTAGVGQPSPDWTTSRIVRVYARQRGCVLAKVSPLTGGLSGVPVIRIEMEKPDGIGGGSAVGRIAPIAKVEEERVRLQQRVSGVLPLGSYAEILGVVRAGACGMGAAFYQVAADAKPLWALISDDDAGAAAAVDSLRSVYQSWTGGAPAVTVDLREIRQILIADGRWDDVSNRCELSLATTTALEDSHVHIRRSTVHADLHAGNVLVGTDPVLIDFASVTVGPTPLDPVSLELAVLFHPDAPAWDGGWPTAADLENWADLDAYVVGCPFPLFVRACRAWAVEAARAERDFFACAYAYVASQARFETSSSERLTRLMAAIIPHLGP